jgi:hypothetical protein
MNSASFTTADFRNHWKPATRKTGITAMQKEPQLFSIILWTSLSKSFDILKLPVILYFMDIFIKQLTEF